MKKVKLFEEFIVEAKNTKEIAKNILNDLDKNSQLFPDYIPAEALREIESALKKAKGAAKAAKEIRTNLDEIGILSNTLSPMDVEIMIMNHLNEGLNEAKFKVGDKWEWNTSDGVKIVSITNIKSNGDIVGKEEGSSEDFIVRDANKYLKKKVVESLNEAKELDRDSLMDLLETKYKIRTVRTSEDFNGQIDGIWLAADNEEELGGNKIFDYYNNSSKYTNGVLKQFRTAIEKTGWWFEWNDPGTIMIWPKN
jgi:hypothetical protein